MHSSRLQVRCLSTDAELEGMRETWTALLEEAPHARIWQTWEWANTWWRHRKSTWKLWLLVALDEVDRVVGILPLMQALPQPALLTLRRLTFFASHFCPAFHGDIIARPEDEDATTTAFLDYLLTARRDDWDVLDLDGLAERSTLRKVLCTCHSHHAERDPDPCPFIPLPSSWETYEREYLSAHRRQEVRRKSRRLEREYPNQVHYVQVTTASALPPAIDRLIDLNRSRWSAAGLTASLDDPHFVAVCREWAMVANQRGWLRFYLLEVAGQAIGADLCLRYGSVVCGFLRAIDMEWERYSPGQLLTAHVIRSAIDEGAREFDMLRGAHEYKLSWTSHVRMSPHPVLSHSRHGDMWLLSGALFETSRSAARRVVPMSMRDSINRLLDIRHSA
jgi:CelD/BcsL family acetyltransferase involved in cellulose biosynthesis